jgi:hypothetical protein
LVTNNSCITIMDLQIQTFINSNTLNHSHYINSRINWISKLILSNSSLHLHNYNNSNKT